MLKEDPWSNPGLLDADRGEGLWKTPAGPNKVSLEKCDLGKGAGVVDGAFAELPRYFADAEQGDGPRDAPDVVHGEAAGHQARRPGQEAVSGRRPAGEGSRRDRHLCRQQVERHEVSRPSSTSRRRRPSVDEGHAIFFRRQGPHDFACATCHNDSGKRIRLQGLPYLADPKEAKQVVGQWPAYRVSTTQVMTMQHRLYDCYWQMRMPELEMGSDVSVALIAYLTKNAEGGEISAPGLKR